MISNKKKRGYFIVFEGIDGAGSSTQALLLQEYFSRCQQKSVISPEPTHSRIGKLIREFLSTPPAFASEELFEQQMAYLFSADRHYHLYNSIDGVKKMVEDNIHVIATRYYFSSLAYNTKNPQQYEFVSLLNKNFPPPDFLFYLDIPVDVALARIENRHKKEVYENREKLLLVKDNFEKILSDYPYPHLRVDAAKSQQEIHQQIVSYLETVAFGKVL